MAKYTFTYHSSLPTLNEYIDIERGNKYKANKLKQDTETALGFVIKNQLRGVEIKEPVYINYTWVQRNKKKDKDNIAFAKKFIQDALVKSGVLKNDGWNCITGFRDRFEIGKENKVIVEIEEVKK